MIRQFVLILLVAFALSACEGALQDLKKEGERLQKSVVTE